MSDGRVRLAITLGDPRGIGPEIIAKALAHERLASSNIDFVLVGPTSTSVTVHEPVGEWSATAAGGADSSALVAKAGALAGLAIERAVQLVQVGAVDGIVTAPLDKAALHADGYDYPGHTEMLAALTGTHTTMMLVSDVLRVVLATTHIALRDVPTAVTEAAITAAANGTRDGLHFWFGIEHPRLALCAMNPHAGDGGRFGDEDQRILAPAARANNLTGPLPADTVFVRAMRGEFDAVLAPYHDVGMTAIKVASFGSAVNVTLGLPFIRTSPDHGTAIDIAGQGIADAGSMITAIEMARDCIVRTRSR
ncbi:MAG: 4-hydroxythreonine-4-phosphate dehydrogenase PdxA [Gemmatimonadota bacterium]|nr:4-hydroxythreonine-4-phosphate dehydrogenase PdxA [Gemmatimonadota bacterium]